MSTKAAQDATPSHLRALDYSVVQQCMHCGLCLPTCLACHLCHGQKITAQPRQVLRAIPNLTLVELPESPWCCGSAGIYNLIQPEMANQLLERKINHIRSTGAEVVATGNPGCLLQLMNGLKRSGCPVRVVHPITLLAEAYRVNETARPRMRKCFDGETVKR